LHGLSAHRVHHNALVICDYKAIDTAVFIVADFRNGKKPKNRLDRLPGSELALVETALTTAF